MILLLTLNPSILRTSIIEGVELNTINNITDYKVEFNDGLIYAAKTIKTLQGETVMLGFLGGPGGRFMKNYLVKNKIKSDFTWLDKDIKTIHKILDSINGTETIMKNHGINVDNKLVRFLFQKYQNHLANISTVVFSGEIPNGLTENELKKIISLAKEKHKKVIINLENNIYVKMLECGITSVAILNKDSLSLMNIDIKDKEDMLKKCYQLLLDYRLKYMMIDLDEEGIYTLTKNKICFAHYPEHVDEVKLTGLKDTLVGSFALGLDRQYEQERLTKLVAAVGLAYRSKSEICRKDIDYYHKRVKVLEIMSKSKGFIKISQ